MRTENIKDTTIVVERPNMQMIHLGFDSVDHAEGWGRDRAPGHDVCSVLEMTIEKTVDARRNGHFARQGNIIYLCATRTEALMYGDDFFDNTYTLGTYEIMKNTIMYRFEEFVNTDGKVVYASSFVERGEKTLPFRSIESEIYARYPLPILQRMNSVEFIERRKLPAIVYKRRVYNKDQFTGHVPKDDRITVMVRVYEDDYGGGDYDDYEITLSTVKRLKKEMFPVIDNFGFGALTVLFNYPPILAYLTDGAIPEFDLPPGIDWNEQRLTHDYTLIWYASYYDMSGPAVKREYHIVNDRFDEGRIFTHIELNSVFKHGSLHPTNFLKYLQRETSFGMLDTLFRKYAIL